VAKKLAGNLKTVSLLMNCESSDEFGLAGETQKLHDTFRQLGVPHEHEIYDEAQAKTFEVVPKIRTGC
jgi:hypothetical protein